MVCYLSVHRAPTLAAPPLRPHRPPPPPPRPPPPPPHTSPHLIPRAHAAREKEEPRQEGRQEGRAQEEGRQEEAGCQEAGCQEARQEGRQEVGEEEVEWSPICMSMRGRSRAARGEGVRSVVWCAAGAGAAASARLRECGGRLFSRECVEFVRRLRPRADAVRAEPARDHTRAADAAVTAVVNPAAMPR